MWCYRQFSAIKIYCCVITKKASFSRHLPDTIWHSWQDVGLAEEEELAHEDLIERRNNNVSVIEQCT